MHCPRCHCDLSKISHQNKIFIFSCPICHGQALTMSGLRSLGVDENDTRSIWSAALNGNWGKELPCPECGNLMHVVKIDDGQSVFYIDICTKCHILWFDFGELEKIPLAPPENKEDIPQLAKEILAENAIKNVKPPVECKSDNWMLYATYRNFRIPSEEESRFFIAATAISALIRLLLAVL